MKGNLLTWLLSDGNAFTTRALPQPGEFASIGDGWGQRDPFNHDEGATLPYIVRRTEGPGLKQFVSLFEPHLMGKPFVRSAKRDAVPGAGGGIAIDVETETGHDYIVSGPHVSVTSCAGDKTDWTFDDEH